MMAAAAATAPFPTVHIAPGSVNVPIATFPAAPKTPPSDVNQIAQEIVATANDAIAKKDYSALSNLFLETGFWRDHLALTWDFRTVQGPSAIRQFLENAASSPGGFRLTKLEVDGSAPHRAPKIHGPGVHFFVDVETVAGRGQGVVHAVEDHGKWKIFTLYTSLRELKGHEEQTYARRPVGVEHGGIPGRTNWADRRRLAADFKDGSEPAVFILG